MSLQSYESGEIYDEMFAPLGQARSSAAPLWRRLEALSAGDLQRYQNTAMVTMRNLGITFNVYGHEDGTEKVWPLDIIPRIIDATEWRRVERGLKQRVHALNCFAADIYGEQKILKDGVVPRSLVESSEGYRPQCQGIRPPGGVWCHITGTDLVRDKNGTLYVLEDNMRVPSGVSYVLENRAVMKRAFPRVFDGLSVLPVEDYPERLLGTLQDVAPEGIDDPTVVLWTPGIYNSAYFEHSALARQMGVKLVEAGDLVVDSGYVHMRTTRGLKRVHVIYRRIDDEFMDPACFREDSMLGVPGIMDVFRAGRVAIANAPGGGVGDDKAVYAYVPEIIKYYLAEEAILPNVPTFLCERPSERAHVLEHLHELVTKPTNGSGGKGIVIGPAATRAELDDLRALIAADPRNFVAQPLLSLSTVPTIIDDHLEGRHVDLRPFILQGRDIYVLPGGLTRVALRKGSTVVNSSQGGGSKDTWVLSNGFD